MRQRGLTLVELLVSVVVMGLAMAAVSRAFDAGIRFESRYSEALEDRRQRASLEDSLGRLFEGANLKGRFVCPVGKDSGSLTFSTWSAPAAYSFLTSDSQDFESLNERFGPQGGSAEVSITSEPVGDAGIREGLFLRTQRPPDSDSSQGGEQTVIDTLVRDIKFEFYDGTNWLTEWDSAEAQKDRLPKAVRITLSRTSGTPQVLFYRVGGAT